MYNDYFLKYVSCYCGRCYKILYLLQINVANSAEAYWVSEYFFLSICVMYSQNVIILLDKIVYEIFMKRSSSKMAV